MFSIVVLFEILGLVISWAFPLIFPIDKLSKYIFHWAALKVPVPFIFKTVLIVANATVSNKITKVNIPNINIFLLLSFSILHTPYIYYN